MTSPTSSDVVIQARGLAKSYRLRRGLFPLPSFRPQTGKSRDAEVLHALRDVSFDILRGETVGIVGRNGSGKSTLLQLISGISRPSGGKLEVSGRITALLELGAGFHPDMSGRENVFMQGAILGIPAASIAGVYDAIVGFAELDAHMDRPVKEYSSGMFVRLAFAAATHFQPDILVVDEALSVGDELFQRKCFGRIAEIRENGGTILVVSHSAQTLLQICDRALFLERGERILFSSPRIVLREYQNFLYAPAGKHPAVLERLRKIDQDGATSAHDGEDEAAGESAESDTAYDPDQFLLPSLSYQPQGAEIKNLRLESADGAPVHLVASGQIVHVRFEAIFQDECHGVHFGAHFRAVSGLELTGQRFPVAGQEIETIHARVIYSVRFSFAMTLLPGIYFLSAGVWSQRAPHCLHRLVDALAVRVTPGNALGSIGLFDASSDTPEVKPILQ